MTKKPEIVKGEDLIRRKDGFYYKKYTKVVFTGTEKGFFAKGDIYQFHTWYEHMSSTGREEFIKKMKDFEVKEGQFEYPTWFEKAEISKEDFNEKLKKFEVMDGKLKYYLNYKNGKEEGPYEYFHENGQLSSKGNYKNGKRHGPSQSFYENGLLLSRENFKNGKLIELWIRNHGKLKPGDEFFDDLANSYY